HDFGTTFKAYRRDLLDHINLYGDNHRFIPALAHMAGAKITEVPIKNIAAPSRPIHLFGKLGLGSFALSFIIFTFLLVRKIMGVSLLAEHGPLMILGVMLF